MQMVSSSMESAKMDWKLELVMVPVADWAVAPWASRSRIASELNAGTISKRRENIVV